MYDDAHSQVEKKKEKGYFSTSNIEFVRNALMYVWSGTARE